MVSHSHNNGVPGTRAQNLHIVPISLPPHVSSSSPPPPPDMVPRKEYQLLQTELDTVSRELDRLTDERQEERQELRAAKKRLHSLDTSAVYRDKKIEKLSSSLSWRASLDAIPNKQYSPCHKALAWYLYNRSLHAEKITIKKLSGFFDVSIGDMIKCTGFSRVEIFRAMYEEVCQGLLNKFNKIATKEENYKDGKIRIRLTDKWCLENFFIEHDNKYSVRRPKTSAPKKCPHCGSIGTIGCLVCFEIYDERDIDLHGMSSKHRAHIEQESTAAQARWLAVEKANKKVEEIGYHNDVLSDKLERLERGAPGGGGTAPGIAQYWKAPGGARQEEELTQEYEYELTDEELDSAFGTRRK